MVIIILTVLVIMHAIDSTSTLVIMVIWQSCQVVEANINSYKHQNCPSYDPMSNNRLGILYHLKGNTVLSSKPEILLNIRVQCPILEIPKYHEPFLVVPG